MCDLPQEHSLHLHTTNPIESIFARVRLRTDVAWRFPNRDNAVYLVFKVVLRLSQHWRRVSGSNLCHLVVEGKPFVNGRLLKFATA